MAYEQKSFGKSGNKNTVYCPFIWSNENVANMIMHGYVRLHNSGTYCEQLDQTKSKTTGTVDI